MAVTGRLDCGLEVALLAVAVEVAHLSRIADTTRLGPGDASARPQLDDAGRDPLDCSVGSRGDPASAIRVLVDHYETTGDRVLRLLAEEQHNPTLRPIADQGRTVHRDWCARVFARALAKTQGLKRERRLAQLVAICDVYTWKLLRRDAALSRSQTELALVELLNPLLEES
ncbi:MAG: hypothetical protein M3Y62_08175 [Candidatus Dormibacteraeota bacterium]|nr:hypothetical protein [Candidatus Dormibacteraeota bacterium]